MFSGKFIYFFPKIKGKMKRKHTGKYSGLKAPGKFKFSEKFT